MSLIRTIQQVLRAPITHDNRAQPLQRGQVVLPLSSPLESEFQQHGTNPQWIADQLRKMEGQ